MHKLLKNIAWGLLGVLGLFLIVSPAAWALKVQSVSVEYPKGTNVSSNPRIEFERGSVSTGAYLCATIDAPADELVVEIFKFADGSNPLDPQSTPPIRTIQFPNPAAAGPYCSWWKGDYNILGEFGKTNGQFGFRATATISTSNANGTFTETHVNAYPGADQQPLVIDVMNVHTVRTLPTTVGHFTPVAAAPYVLSYRLSKSATATITIYDAGVTPPTLVRTLVSKQPREGDGLPDGTTTNADAWDGRDNYGARVSSGVYMALIQASAQDFAGWDLADGTTRQISMDPLQITDVDAQDLGSSSTALALINFMLTEPMQVTWRIYQTTTVFNNVNNPVPTPTAGKLLREIIEQHPSRVNRTMFWDGRDSNGNLMTDGNYACVLYSQDQENPDRYTSKAWVGTVPLKRGLIDISQIQINFTSIGNNPTAGGLQPFTFQYSLSRDASVTLKIFKSAATPQLVRTLISEKTRPAYPANNTEIWDGKNDAGVYVSSGVYLAELNVRDPIFTANVTTTTVPYFPVNLFRAVDVVTAPLLTGTSDNATISYQLSETMNARWTIYLTTAVVDTTAWPPIVTPSDAVRTIYGQRPGRKKITEFWDGRNEKGLFVPDGDYVCVLTAQDAFGNYAEDKTAGKIAVTRGQLTFPAFNVISTIPQLFSSSQTVSLPPYEIDFSITRESSVTVRVLNSADSSVMRNIILGQVRPSGILNKEFWDGRNNTGSMVPSGFYVLEIIAQDYASLSSSTSTIRANLSVSPYRIYDVAVLPVRYDIPNGEISYQLSEVMKVSLKIYRPNTTFDLAGSPSPAESLSLVRKIVGIRPARTLIREFWDGTDEKRILVEDGNYIFRLVASTSTDSIDDQGNVAAGAPLAADMLISNFSVTRLSSLDPQSDMEKNTIIYPNPITRDQATIRILVPMTASVNLKLYTLNGDLILDKDFGRQVGNTYLNYSWTKTNEAGRKVASGVYFAVIRQETLEGDKLVLQTVKKMLIP